jgi:hypothetical protein
VVSKDEPVGASLKQRARMRLAGRELLYDEQRKPLRARFLCSPHRAGTLK